MIKKSLNFLLIISVFFAPRLFSQETDDEKKKLKLLADFRFRFEVDWDSRRFDGSYAKALCQDKLKKWAEK
jgi:hypothetical protein